VGDQHACATRGGLVVEPQNHLAVRIAVFAQFGPQNSVMAVPMGIKDVMWSHHGGCVEAKHLRVERMTIRSKSHELVYFAPG
jgi:sarcosine oxidase delta subunit